MQTKTVTLAKVSASFSTSAQHVVKVTMPRAPWDEILEDQSAKISEKPVADRGIGR
jgi:hypothetical protein